MIPNLDSLGIQSKRDPWIRTMADTLLEDCTELSIVFMGKKYPIWKYLEMYCPILDVEGHKIPWALNNPQIECYRLFEEQMREMGYVRVNEGKGRQMGSSTLTCGILFTKMVTTPGFRVAILADTQDKGRGLLAKYKFFYANQPEPFRTMLKQAEVVNNADNLAFDFGNEVISSVSVIVANENAGASYTFQAIHASEVALWERISETLSALEQTVADAPGTIIVRETTSRGPNEWKDYYDAGKEEGSNFRSIFLAWYMLERYVKPYDGHTLTKHERFLHDDLGIDLDHIQWWYVKWLQFHRDLDYMLQEYPSTEDEMWRSKSVGIFDFQILQKRREEIRKEEPLFVGTPSFVRVVNEDEEVDGDLSIEGPFLQEEPFGSAKIFVAPKLGHPYALSCDPAEGGSDYHAIHVIDCSNDEQCAVIRVEGRKVLAMEAAFQSYVLLLYYQGNGDIYAEEPVNRVYVTGERNITNQWLRTMKRLGCDVRMDKSDDESQSELDKLGYRTTVSNRKAMIDSFAAAFRDSYGKIIHDRTTLSEMDTFQYKQSGITKKEKPQAIGNAHDDTVMAYCGYFHCKFDFDCSIIEPRKIESKKKAYDPFDTGPKNRTKGVFQRW